MKSIPGHEINSGLKFCCETGIKLQEQNISLHAISQGTPSKYCQSIMKLCGVIHQKSSQACDTNHIVTNFNQFCEKSPTKYEACCYACYLGEEFSTQSPTCSKENFPNFTNSTVDLIRECCLRKKSDLGRYSGLYFKDTAEGCSLEDVNECEIENNGCDDSQVCVNTVGSYFCAPRGACKLRYSFNRETLTCDMKYDYATIESETRVVPFSEFIDHSACSPGFKWNKDSQTCDDVDECKEKRLCDHSCVNTIGGFKCNCREGYRINVNQTWRCDDINECFENLTDCSHGCRNTIGCYDCTCPEGFKLKYDGKTCLNIDECPEGFRLGIDGITCRDVNECLVKRNLCPGKICNNFIGGYSCVEPVCPQGYRPHNNGKEIEANIKFK